MKNEIYSQIYKCRMCGAEFCPVTTSGKEKTMEYMDDFLKRACGASKYMLYMAPEQHKAHFCKSGDIGVADFIGYKRQEL